MRAEEKLWFEKAYEIARKSSFCFSHTPVPESFAFHFGLDYAVLKNSWNTVPSLEAFLEVKDDVRRRIVPLLQEIFPSSSAVYWGKDKGDLDIAIVSPEPREIPLELKHEFPIVDWCGLDYFAVPSGKDFIDQLIRCEKMYAESAALTPEQALNVAHIVESAKPLWGEMDLNRDWSVYGPDQIAHLSDKPILSAHLYPVALHR